MTHDEAKAAMARCDDAAFYASNSLVKMPAALTMLERAMESLRHYWTWDQDGDIGNDAAMSMLVQGRAAARALLDEWEEKPNAAEPKLEPCPWCGQPTSHILRERFQAMGLNVEHTMVWALEHYDELMRRLANDPTTNATTVAVCTCNPSLTGRDLNCPLHGTHEKA